jgi:hypothetical protein
VNAGDLGADEEATVWLEGAVDACDGDWTVEVSLRLADAAGDVANGNLVVQRRCTDDGDGDGRPWDRDCDDADPERCAGMCGSTPGQGSLALAGLAAMLTARRGRYRPV